MLVALGLRNLPGVLLLTPVEAMLLAAFGSWHPHDGRRDWLVPPLLQAAEYVFLAEVGFADGVWPAMTFALVAAAGFRHLDLVYRVRGGLASGVDRRGLGWEGRMIVAGIAAAAGIQAASTRRSRSTCGGGTPGTGRSGVRVSWTCRHRPLASRRS